MADTIDKILESRRQQAAQSPLPKEDESDRFFSILGGDVLDDPFLEFRFRDGFKLCLPYRDVVWIAYDPKGPDIKLDFGSTVICIKGRGLGDDLFDALKRKQVVWIKEADSEMQDHDKNKVFIGDISFEPEEEKAGSGE